MKLSVLVDNNTLIDRYFLGEPGLSFFIEDEDTSVLFDVGYSDAFIKNAQKMQIDLLKTDKIVLSHGHLDHTWGLFPLAQLFTEAKLESLDHTKPSLTAHPHVFSTRSFSEIPEIGSLLSEEKLAEHFSLELGKAPKNLTENLIYLGEIERLFEFEAQYPIGKMSNGADDYILDDTALVYRSLDGLIIITGCSHAGICNIIEYAKNLCRDDRIVDIIGGFHLQNPSQQQLEGTLKYMKKLKPDAVHACHCTDLQSKIELSQVVPIREVGAGLVLEY